MSFIKQTLLAFCSLFTILMFSSGKNSETKVKISTSEGDIILKLYDDTPLHKENFLKLVKDGFYDELLFHRIIKDFMIQAGDPDSKGAPEGKVLGMGGPGYTIPAEIKPQHVHVKGALAAARLSDQVNPQKESSGSQFYIVQGTAQTEQGLKQFENQKLNAAKNKIISEYIMTPANKAIYDSLVNAQKSGDKQTYMNIVTQVEGQLTDTLKTLENLKYSESQIQEYIKQGGTPHLDFEYTVFGEVLEGLDVIDKISRVATDPNGRPKQDIPMKVKIIK